MVIIGSEYWLFIALVAMAVFALALAGWITAKKYSSAFYRSLAAALAATGLLSATHALGLGVDADVLFWRRVGLVLELCLGTALVFAGSVLLANTEGLMGRVVRWQARAIGVFSIVVSLCAWSDGIYALPHSNVDLTPLILGRLGQGMYVFLLLAQVLALAQFEQVLRAGNDPLRYRIKFVLIGLGTLGAYGIYQAAQLLLYREWIPQLVWVAGCTTLMALTLITYGLGRNRLREVKTSFYVSPQILYGSFTFLAGGVYLLVTGLVAQLIRASGWELSLSLSTMVLFVAGIGLVSIFFSRAARAEVRRFVFRHFYRSKYDYRAQWLEVTKAFGASASVEAILDRLQEILSHTFGASRISIWIPFEADGRYHQVRSANTLPPPPPLDTTHPLIARLSSATQPVQLDGSLATGTAENPEGVRPDQFLQTTQAVLCVPILSDTELLGFITLSRERHNESYGVDDYDLLGAIAHHAAVLLAHARLATERHAAAGLEALHRFSAFCLHDLKNLAARLSLVVQNAREHGQDPDFQQSAMQTVESTVRKIQALIAELSAKEEPTRRHVGRELVDMGELLNETVRVVPDALRARIDIDGHRLPPVWAVREQLQQVLLNVMLNAQQAIELAPRNRGEVDIEVRCKHTDGVVAITIADHGPGMAPAMLRTLFQPFRTVKPEGLGIGLFHSKQIIEAHHGRILVESEIGRGTQVRIELPTADARVSTLARRNVASGKQAKNPAHDVVKCADR